VCKIIKYIKLRKGRKSFLKINLAIVIILCIPLIMGSYSHAEHAEICIREESQLGIKEDRIFDSFGNYKITYIQTDFPKIPSGGPDLAFKTLQACWGYNDYCNVDGLYVNWMVINIGDTYKSDEPICISLAFYINDEEEPFEIFEDCVVIDPYTWKTGESTGWDYFFVVKKKLATLTIHADYHNIIPEQNEDNNIKTVEVVRGITISGKVCEKINGQEYPIKDYAVMDGTDALSPRSRYFKTDENGNYKMTIYPKKPYGQSFVYNIIAQNDDATKRQLRITKKLRVGGNTNINFLFEGMSPDKPSILERRHSGATNVEYIFKSLSTHPENLELYYLFVWQEMDWNNGYHDLKYTTSGWLGPFESGTICTASKAWDKSGIKHIFVVCKDKHGTLSPNSDDFMMLISKSRSRDIYSKSVFALFDRIQKFFPFLSLFKTCISSSPVGQV